MTCGNTIYNPLSIVSLILAILFICIIVKLIYDMMSGCNQCTSNKKCKEHYADTVDASCVDNPADDVVEKYFAIHKTTNALYVKTSLDADWKIADNFNKYISYVKNIEGAYIAVFTDGMTRIKKRIYDQWTLPETNEKIGKYLKTIGNLPDANSTNYAVVPNTYVAVGPGLTVHQRTGFTGPWKLLNNNAACCVTEIFYDAPGRQYVGISAEGRLHTKPVIYDTIHWTDISDGDPVKIVSIAKEGDTWYGVGMDDGELYSKTILTGRWNKYKTKSNIPLLYINFFKDRRG